MYNTYNCFCADLKKKCLSDKNVFAQRIEMFSREIEMFAQKPNVFAQEFTNLEMFAHQ